MRSVAVVLLALLVATACGASTTTIGSSTGAATEDEPSSSDVKFNPSDLTDPVACSTGFRTRNSSSTIGLKINIPLDSSTERPVDDAMVFDIELQQATGSILIGRRLFDQLCNDVYEPDEQQEVDQSWRLISGIVTLQDQIRADDSGGGGIGRITAKATDLVAEKPSGERVEIGELDLVNGKWAFYGG